MTAPHPWEASSPPGPARLPDGPRVHPDIDCVQVLREIVFRAELPKSPVGKILRAQLRNINQIGL